MSTVFPGLGLLLAAFIIAAVLIWRNKSKLKLLKKPNFQEIAFGKDFTEEAPQLTSEQKEELKSIEEVTKNIFDLLISVDALRSTDDTYQLNLRCYCSHRSR
jgi:hypothetical protein